MNRILTPPLRYYSLLLLWLFIGTAGVTSRLAAQATDRDTLHLELEKEQRQIFPLKNLSWAPAQEMTVSLALSGGGARGLAHIGVLKALEEHDIPVQLIVGTSMGAIIGGFYSAGFSAAEIERIVAEIDWNSIFSDRTYRSQLLLSQKQFPQRHVLQLRLDGFLPIIPSAITQGQLVFQTLYNKLLASRYQSANHFDRLKIPFRAVATDLVTGRRTVLEDGDLAEAINASLALPLIFSPVEIDSMMLVDGGIMENLPVQAAQESGGDLVIAVDVSSPLRKWDDISTAFEVADQVTTIMMIGSTKESRARADVLILPELAGYNGADFGKATALIDSGYAATIRRLPQIKESIQQVKSQENATGSMLGRVRLLSLNGVPFDLADRLETELFSAVGREVHYQDVLEDMRHIYEEGVFSDVKARVILHGEQVDIAFHAFEQPYVRSVTFSEQKILPDSLLQEIALSHQDTVLNMRRLYEDLQGIRDTLVDQGYALADIELVDYQSDIQGLHISIDEGVVGRIEIIGNEVTRDHVITRALPLKKGDIFNGPAAASAIEEIYSTNLFDRVRLALKRDSDENVLQIRVKERKYYLMRLGSHYDLDRKVDAFVELALDNFLGSATQASLFGMTGDHARGVEVNLQTVRLYKSYWTARTSFYANRRTERFYDDFERLEDYRINRSGMRVGIGQQIDKLGLISAELRLENVSLESSDTEFRFADSYGIRSISLNSVVDKRDKLPFPEKGIYNRWSWEAGNNSILGSNVPFTKIFAGLEGYYPLTGRLNLHPFLFAGTADRTLPFSEYFFVGGPNSMPGIHEKELFGRQYVHTGTDLRVRLTEDMPFEIYFLGRYTAAATWEEPNQRIRAGDFFHSISASLILHSLLGPLKFTYGKVAGEVDKLHFSFGFDF